MGASMESIKGERAKRLLNVSFKNLGTVNQNRVTLETEKANLIIDFSYQTPVSFALRGGGKFINMTRQNDWGPTTGKLLNDCEPDKKARVSGEVFEKGLAKALKQILKK